jgi:hypothetical protein
LAGYFDSSSLASPLLLSGPTWYGKRTLFNEFLSKPIPELKALPMVCYLRLKRAEEKGVTRALHDAILGVSDNFWSDYTGPSSSELFSKLNTAFGILKEFGRTQGSFGPFLPVLWVDDPDRCADLLATQELLRAMSSQLPNGFKFITSDQGEECRLRCPYSFCFYSLPFPRFPSLLDPFFLLS